MPSLLSFQISFMYFRLFLLALFSIYSIPSLADTVWMKNGDRLTGTISLLNNNKLVIDTNYAGSVTIKWEQVSTLETGSPLLIKLKQDKQEKAKTIKPSTEGKLQLINGTSQEIALQDINQIIKPKKLAFEVNDLIWTGNADISLDSKKADKNSNTFDIDFLTKLEHGKWRHTFAGEYNRKSSDGNVSTNNYSLDYTFDHFITKQWFWQTNSYFKLDHVEDLRKQYTLGSGPGYQFWDDSSGAFSLSSPINLSRYEYRDSNRKNFGAYGIRWNYNQYLLGKNFQFFTLGNLTKPGNNNVAKYTLDADIGIRYKVTDWASLNFKVNRNIVDGASDSNVNETRYIFGFGVNW